MAQLFQRAVRITLTEPQARADAREAVFGADAVGALQKIIENLRVQLKIKQTSGKEPNECTLTIYNLSADSRALLQSKGTRIIVEAGYAGTIAQIFSGTSSFIDHVHEGPLWLTKVQCSDGEIPYHKPVKGSFKKGTPVATVFERVAELTGLDVKTAATTFKNLVKEQFTKGYTAFGKGGVELDKLVQGRGLEWSIQDNRLQLLPIGGTTNDTAVVLSPTTGLVGSPAHGSPDAARKKPAVLTVKSLMQPTLRPGRKVRVEDCADKSVNGNFRCVSVTHEGDTAGGAWYSEAEITPI